MKKRKKSKPFVIKTEIAGHRVGRSKTTQNMQSLTQCLREEAVQREFGDFMKSTPSLFTRLTGITVPKGY